MFQFQFHLDLNEIPIPEIDTLFGICSKIFPLLARNFKAAYPFISYCSIEHV